MATPPINAGLDPAVTIGGPITGTNPVVTLNGLTTGAVSSIAATAPIHTTGATGAITVSHDASGVSAGTYGDATHVAQVAVDAKGHVTGATAVAITGTAPGGSAGGDLGGTYPNPTVLSVAHVNTGTLGVGNGGTGAASLAGHGAVVMNSGGIAQTVVAPGASGNLLTSNGTDWVSSAPVPSVPTYIVLATEGWVNVASTTIIGQRSIAPADFVNSSSVTLNVTGFVTDPTNGTCVVTLYDLTNSATLATTTINSATPAKYTPATFSVASGARIVELRVAISGATSSTGWIGSASLN